METPHGAENPTPEAGAAVPKPQPVEATAAIAGRTIPPRLLFAAGAACLFIGLPLVVAAVRSWRPDVQPAAAAPVEQTTPTPSANSDAPVIAEVLPAPAWVGRRQAGWERDGTKSVTFALAPVNDVPIRTTRGWPQLVARCLSRRTEVYVLTGPLTFEGQEGRHTVLVQVDDDPEESQQWLDSDTSQELFAPDGVALSDRLVRAHRLRLGFTPFGGDPVTLEFIVDGFDQLAPVLARTCGRRLSRPVR